MDQLFDFFKGIAHTSHWPPRWHCGTWSDFHGWLYIVSDLMIWSAYFAIPMFILKYIQNRRETTFLKMYLLFAAFILACGLTHLLSAISFWVPLYRLSALVLFITGVISWVTVYSLIKILPEAFEIKSRKTLEFEIEQRKKAEEELQLLNESLDELVEVKSEEAKEYKYALDQSGNIVITDEMGTIKNVNENYCKISGYSKVELIGKNVLSSFKNHHTSSFLDNILKEIVQGKTWRGDLCSSDKNNLPYWMAATIVPFRRQVAGSLQFLFIFIDIKERKEAEKNVLEKSKEIDDILDRITDGFISLDHNFNYTYANKKVGEMLGRNPSSLIGKHVWEEFPDAVHSATYKSFHKAIKEQKFICSQDYYAPLDLWQENHIYPYKDGLFIFIRDISKQKRAEILIKNSENKFRNLIEHGEDLITLLDKDLNVIYRSPSAERITGKSAEENKRNPNTIDAIHPDDREHVGKTFKRVSLVPGLSEYVCFRMILNSESYIWLEGSVTNKLQEESIQALVINFRDITKRKNVEEQLVKSEKIYKTIASSIPDSVICIFDLDLTYLLIEGDMLTKLGYSKAMLLGKKISDVVDAVKYKSWRDDFDRSLNGEVFFKETNNNGIDLLTRFVPLKDANNKPYGFMTVAIDVTALKNAQKEIKKLNDDLEIKISKRTGELQEVNRELEAFSYSVSHDLRAPLRSINGYSKMLEEDYASLLDDNGLRILLNIQKNARRMGTLIDDLLSFSRIGKLEVKRNWIDMTTMVRSVVAELTEHHHSNLVVEIDPLHSCFADAPLITQVFTNFISNAIKYSSKKEYPKIVIHSERLPGEVVYSIADNGTGFNMEYVNKLFGVFQRLHSTSEYEGTGVGLAIIKRIVEKHGGKVWANGALNEGATFYFSLPQEDQ